MDKLTTKPVICWWSGGVTSAVACKIALDTFINCRIIFIDTFNEDDDTYRFRYDCEKWYQQEIESITVIGEKYNSIEDVWYKYNSLNVAHGAICSSELKREVRQKWQNENNYKHQVFGFDIDEHKRAKMLSKNYKKARAVFPLLFHSLTKKDCIQILQDNGIKVPITYEYGFHNNNCFKTGCVQGGIGYWQKMKRDFPEKFNKMAKVEHELTNRKGKPVTMLKDQSKDAKESKNTLVFLERHKDYPNIKTIDQMEGREPKPLMECNGFCSTNLLDKPNETENEINFQLDLF